MIDLWAAWIRVPGGAEIVREYHTRMAASFRGSERLWTERSKSTTDRSHALFYESIAKDAASAARFHEEAAEKKEVERRLLEAASRGTERRLARLQRMKAGDDCPRCGHPVEAFPGAPGFICARCDWRSTELGTPAEGPAGELNERGWMGLLPGEEP
jgi:RNA polymerase-binding transcription factor DksA